MNPACIWQGQDRTVDYLQLLCSVLCFSQGFLCFNSRFLSFMPFPCKHVALRNGYDNHLFTPRCAFMSMGHLPVTGRNALYTSCSVWNKMLCLLMQDFLFFSFFKQQQHWQIGGVYLGQAVPAFLKPHVENSVVNGKNLGPGSKGLSFCPGCTVTKEGRWPVTAQAPLPHLQHVCCYRLGVRWGEGGYKALLPALAVCSLRSQEMTPCSSRCLAWHCNECIFLKC